MRVRNLFEWDKRAIEGAVGTYFLGAIRLATFNPTAV